MGQPQVRGGHGVGVHLREQLRVLGEDARHVLAPPVRDVRQIFSVRYIRRPDAVVAPGLGGRDVGAAALGAADLPEVELEPAVAEAVELAHGLPPSHAPEPRGGRGRVHGRGREDRRRVAHVRRQRPQEDEVRVDERDDGVVPEVRAREPVPGPQKGATFLNLKGSYLGRFPLVSADFWTGDHISKRSRSVDAFSGTIASGTLMLKRT